MVKHSVREQFDGVIVGCVYAAIVCASGWFQDGPIAADLFLRMFFAFAGGVLMKRPLDGASIELAQDNPPRDARFHYAWALGMPWGMTMVLAFWPLASDQLLIWAACAAFFGCVLAFFAKPEAISPGLLAMYQTDAPFRHAWAGSERYLYGRLLMLGVLALFWASGNDDYRASPIFLMQMVLFLTLTGPFLSANKTQRMLNNLMLFAVLIVGFIFR